MTPPDPDHAPKLTDRLNSADRTDRELMAYVHAEMQRLARSAMRHGDRGLTLSTGAVVNEAFLKLFGQGQQRFRDRGHFLAIAATAMRQVLVDHARSRLAEKRGGGQVTSLDAIDGFDVAIEADAEQIVAIDEALGALDTLDSRARKVFELRFFAGLEVEDVAEVLGVSAPTVKRDARFARAFIGERLGWQTPA
ncbi:MAG TPA: ECF-type sigma factor [Pseudomonadota bacterium]|jgi:RNA polymerase sigma factor (TIGR02999 family)|nr:ECF-type sigma factor [Pseudomonadota bacterium]